MSRNPFNIIPEGMYSRTWPAPEGYQKLSWLDAKAGDVVYVMDLQQPNEQGVITGTVAKGPYTITDARDRWLTDEEGKRRQECGERLVVKQGEQ